MDRGITGTGVGFDAAPAGRAGRDGQRNVPPSQLREAMIQAALRRSQLQRIMPSGARRLGGDRTLQGLPPAEAARIAAERRARDDVWCGGHGQETKGQTQGAPAGRPHRSPLRAAPAPAPEAAAAVATPSARRPAAGSPGRGQHPRPTAAAAAAAAEKRFRAQQQRGVPAAAASPHGKGAGRRQVPIEEEDEIVVVESDEEQQLAAAGRKRRRSTSRADLRPPWANRPHPGSCGCASCNTGIIVIDDD